MIPQKQTVNLSLAQGLDQKSDPKQIPIGKFKSLINRIFNKVGLLEKRNGFGVLPALPDATTTLLTTFKNNLTAVGTSLFAYISGSRTWSTKGSIRLLKLGVKSLIRSNTNQSQVDSVTSLNGLICTVFTDNVPSSGVNVAQYKYVIADATTGQNIIEPTLIPVTSGALDGSARVFLLGNHFVIVFTNVIAAVNHLQYIAISTTNPSSATANVDISSQYIPSAQVAFDGVVTNNILYLAWNGSDGGGAIRMKTISSSFVQGAVVTFATISASMLSVTADETGNTSVIWVTAYDQNGSEDMWTFAVNQSVVTVRAPVQLVNNDDSILNVTSSAANGVVEVFYEIANTYSFGAPYTNLIVSRTLTVGGTLGAQTVIVRSVGLASKAFRLDGVIYFLTTYDTVYQPTYFLVNSDGETVAKLAYSNGGGYLTRGLPAVSISGTSVSIPYLIKDLVQSVSKEQGAPNSGAGIYSQTGINLATFTFSTEGLQSAEIGNNLHLSGGFIWMYDGFEPVEHGFHLYPDPVVTVVSGTGGVITANTYYYVATYEWSDNQGNIFRSSPSIPKKAITTGSTSSIEVRVPTLRLTEKTTNPVKIVIYRWSAAQPIYYQVNSILTPTLNDPTIDEVSILDTVADVTILGNNLLYTTGGVVENIAAPAATAMTLHKSRMYLIDAEDRNLIWYSKQVIEGTPVEFSDLFTFYVAPTLSASGSTGDAEAISPMDDKLIIWKKNAIYYQVGNGPDNTGANNDFSEPVFINSTVGCSNPQSIVFIPDGLMFQSDKGIWLLGRDLSTSYIGAPVEDYNDDEVLSAVSVPGTNQVRFILSSGVTLMYDYFYKQWGTFEGAPAISSTLFENLHTIVNERGEIFRETPGLYLDGTSPVLASFTTAWINLTGLQGFQRAYSLYLLGSYLSPHKLYVKIAYDYNPSATQTSVITPDNFSGFYGDGELYGSDEVYGGTSQVEQWRIFLEKQKCQSFQVTVSESYDPSEGVDAGAGLTLSGMAMLVGAKSDHPRLTTARTVG